MNNPVNVTKKLLERKLDGVCRNSHDRKAEITILIHKKRPKPKNEIIIIFEMSVCTTCSMETQMRSKINSELQVKV